MISQIDKSKIIVILDSVLGSGRSLKKDEQLYYCPFCHHSKMKMNINIQTQQFHCWVCDAKGKSLYSLLRKLNVDKHKISEINKIYGNDYVTVSHSDDVKIELRLPKEFKSALKKPKTFNPMYTNVKYYLNSRGITKSDIIKYNIGYCDSGIYSGRIIIPSYTADNKLNYFISRTIYEDETYKYKNPPVSKNVIALDNQINWSEGLVIVEGVYDAIAVKRNVIPIFGKFLSDELKNKILIKRPPSVTICLDNDAIDGSIKIIEFLLKNHIIVKFAKLPRDSDPSELGFSEMRKILNNSKIMNFSSLISLKIGVI